MLNDDREPGEPQVEPGGGQLGSPCSDWDVEPSGLTEIARRRRDEIMDAAEAIIAGHGIDKLSLAQIEQRAGMSRGQLTYYFPTKESILLAVYERMLRRMIREMLARDGPKPMTGQAWACVQYALGSQLTPNSQQRHQELFSLLFTFLAQMGHRADYRTKLSQVYRGWRDHIAADVAQSVPEPRAVAPRITASIVQALLQGLDIQLMIDPDAFDRDEMLEACVRLLAPAFHHNLIDHTTGPTT